MEKREFEDLAGEVTERDFSIIGFVYTFHPAIQEVGGKKQIADLYKIGGMRVISDMLPTAQRAKALEEEIRTVSLRLDALTDALAELRQG